MTYDVVGTTNGTNLTGFVENEIMADTNENKEIFSNIEIEPGKIHTYSFTLKYKNRNESQDNDRGKKLLGKLEIESINKDTRTATLNGYVYSGGNPVENAIVELHSVIKTTTTDSNGYYELKNVEIGNHTLNIKNSNQEIIGTSKLEMKNSDDEKITIGNKKIILSKESTNVETLLDIEQENIDIKKLNVVNITFNTNGGNTIENKFTVYNMNYGKLPIPTRDKYDFIGWYTEAETGSLVKSITKVNDINNHTLYAHWKGKDGFLVDVASVGSFVAYTPPISKSSVSNNCSGTNQYSGWRVLSKNGSGDTGTVTLIHAGTTDCQYFAYRGGQTSTSVLNNIASGYLNTTYATSTRSISCTDLAPYGGNCHVASPVMTNNLIKTGSRYWLTYIYSNESVWYVADTGKITSTNSQTYGVRPVITLKAKIKTQGGAGTNESPYNITN